MDVITLIVEVFQKATLTVNILNVENFEIDYGKLGICGPAYFNNNVDIYGNLTIGGTSQFQNSIGI